MRSQASPAWLIHVFQQVALESATQEDLL